MAYGIEEDGGIAELEGTLFHHTRTGVRYTPDQVRLLYPSTPGKIVAVGRNYKSHLGKLPEPSRPEIFFKPISCLQDPEGPIVFPPDATDLHYEGELVLVMGKRLRNASKEEAKAAIFGLIVLAVAVSAPLSECIRGFRCRRCLRSSPQRFI